LAKQLNTINEPDCLSRTFPRKLKTITVKNEMEFFYYENPKEKLEKNFDQR
jgi:hypothetical protein